MMRNVLALSVRQTKKIVCRNGISGEKVTGLPVRHLQGKFYGLRNY